MMVKLMVMVIINGQSNNHNNCVDDDVGDHSDGDNEVTY